MLREENNEQKENSRKEYLQIINQQKEEIVQLRQ